MALSSLIYPFLCVGQQRQIVCTPICLNAKILQFIIFRPVFSSLSFSSLSPIFLRFLIPLSLHFYPWLYNARKLYRKGLNRCANHPRNLCHGVRHFLYVPFSSLKEYFLSFSNISISWRVTCSSMIATFSS